MRSRYAIIFHCSTPLANDQKHHTGPSDEPSQPERPAVAFSFSIPSRNRAPSVPSSRTSRSNSRVSQTSSVSEKMTVFKDSAPAAPPDETRAAKAKTPAHSRRKHLRTPFSPMIIQSQPLPTSAVYIDENLMEHNTYADALYRLHAIAAQRAKLLRQLTELQHEEAAVLKVLSISHVPAAASIQNDPVPQQRNPIPLSTRPVSAPPISTPSTSTRSKRAVFGEKDAKDLPFLPIPPSTRPVSAPAVSTPSTTTTTRLFMPFTTRRVALGHSNIEDIPIRDSRPEDTKGCGIHTAPAPTPGELAGLISPSKRGRTMRIPMKWGDAETKKFCPGAGGRFGEDDDCARSSSKGKDAEVEGNDRAGTVARSTSSISKGKSMERNRSGGAGRRHAAPATPAATPGMQRFYEVPETVARKRWEF
jgi:hypothetical protein